MVFKFLMPHSLPRRSGFLLTRQDYALILVTIIWGGSYSATHLALTYCGPLFFVGARFLIAGLVTGIVFSKALCNLTKRDIIAGCIIGLPVCLGQILQTIGLQSITISQSAFLTALYVPIVPLFQWLFMKKAPHTMAWAGLGLSFMGLLLLTIQGASTLSMNMGNCLTLLSAIAIAGEIVFISRFAKSVNTACVTTIQLLTTGLLSLFAMPALGETFPTFSWEWALPISGLGLASIGIQLTMNWAQKSISPTRATIIYAGEPVWGGMFGRLAGERLPSHALLGAGFIVAGVIVSEWRPRFPQSSKKDA